MLTLANPLPPHALLNPLSSPSLHPLQASDFGFWRCHRRVACRVATITERVASLPGSTGKRVPGGRYWGKSCRGEGRLGVERINGIINRRC